MPEIIIVGAGPAGLATAYYLQQAKRPFLMLEKAQVGAAWANHYDSLHLHTLKGVSALPGLPMPTTYPAFPSKEQVLTYLQQYARHFDFPIETGVTVQRAWHENGRWQLSTSAGHKTAVSLVLATGIWSNPYCPDLPGMAQFHGRILHSATYQNPEPFQGQRVLVVGAGNSGAEMAAELGFAGIETGVAIRTGVAFVPEPTSETAVRVASWLFRHLPDPIANPLLDQVRPDYTHLGIPTHPDPPVEAYPVVGDDLPRAVEAGAVTVYPDIVSVEKDGVRFGDGRFFACDVLLMATGFRPAINFMEPVPVLDKNGRLLLPSQFPNLYPIGYYYPATEGWLQAIGRRAKQLVAEMGADA